MSSSPVEIIEALSMHSQLEKLELISMNIGRNECVALANLAFTELRALNLSNNNLDDEGVDALVGAFTNCKVDDLVLSSNPNISARGWQCVANLLECPHSNLEELHLIKNNIGDGSALVFANALSTNPKLKMLGLEDNDITAEGWSGFSKVLCDASSINSTFLSNHTLQELGNEEEMPADVNYSLELNFTDDKKQVAIEKILKHHQHFDMQPFFEWDLKVLPFAISWFERARSIENDEVGIDNHKLGAIYQFVRAMPEVFEPASAA